MWRSARSPSLEGIPDVTLINRLTKRHSDAFLEFHRRYEKVIMQCVRGAARGNPRLEPEDLLQDFFLKLQETAFRDLNRWNRQTPLPLFLRHIVRNFVIDQHRADPTSPGRRRRETMDAREDGNPLLTWVTRVLGRRARLFSGGGTATGRMIFEPLDDNDLEDFSADPTAALESRQLRRRGLEAWARLTSDRDKRLICAKFHRETPADKMAAQEGLSAVTFRKAIFDAQKRHIAHLRTLAPEFFS